MQDSSSVGESSFRSRIEPSVDTSGIKIGLVLTIGVSEIHRLATFLIVQILGKAQPL